jgi:hypothetical protein
VGLEGQPGQRFGEVRRTYLTSSTRAVDGLGQPQLLFFGHVTYLLRVLYYIKSKVKNQISKTQSENVNLGQNHFSIFYLCF